MSRSKLGRVANGVAVGFTVGLTIGSTLGLTIGSTTDFFVSLTISHNLQIMHGLDVGLEF